MLLMVPQCEQPGDVRGDVRPAAAAVLRDVHLAVVGAGPDQPGLEPRLRDGEDHARVLDADVVGREPA